MPAFNPLLNPSLYPADRYGLLADRLKALLSTRNDLVFVQAEAILALEAAATSLARPGLVALNIVTSPYGGYFGQWLTRSGSGVRELKAAAGQPVTVEAVGAALDSMTQVDLVAVVHAETSSGILNPLAEIASLVAARGALLVVDGVASFGGHKLDVDELGIDICVTGPQKAIGGPAGLSMVTVSARAWTAMERAAGSAPSSLSLLDLKTNWLDQHRGALPGMPSPLEFWALEEALDQLEAEGLDSRIARHALAAEASRAGLIGLGVHPWVKTAAQASTLATAAPLPAGTDLTALVAVAAAFGVTLTPGFGEVRDKLVRLDHTGARAALAPVLANVVAYGMGLEAKGHRVDIGAAAASVGRAYAAALAERPAGSTVAGK